MKTTSSIWISAFAISACTNAPAIAPCPRPSEAKTESKTEAPSSRAEIVSLDVGVLVYDISISDTAQIFHIADQLSQWSPFMHKQYMRWAEAEHVLGDPQKAALAAHRALRQRLHYGVLDQHFYTTKSVQDALTLAKADLSADDLEVEKNLFDVMTPILLPFIEQHRAETIAFRDRIVAQHDKLKQMLEDFVQLAQVYLPKDHVPLWLVASTDGQAGGGGFNGGQMVVESGRQSVNTLLHESLHFVLNPKRPEIEAAAKSCGASLDYETLNEGFAYALYPGIVGNRNAIDQTLKQLATQGKPDTDPYVRFNRLGKRLTPLLEKALIEKTTLAAMLPTACDEWKKVVATP